jgi:hypothetical protein
MSGGGLYVIDHCEDAVLVDGRGVLVGMEDVEADALQDTRDALTRIDLVLVEADEHALEVEDLLAVLEQLDEVIAGQLGGQDILGQEEG